MRSLPYAVAFKQQWHKARGKSREANETSYRIAFR
jgi:hypothetical protein